MPEPDSTSLHTITLTDTERALNARTVASIYALSTVTTPEDLIKVGTVLIENFRDDQKQLMLIWERLAPETLA